MAKLVGFLGGPCTGKTTLATAVFNALTEQGQNIAWASEFVTDDIQLNGPPHLDYYIYEQYRFLFHQSRREENALKEAPLVLTDSPLLIGYAYTLLEKEKAVKGRQKHFIREVEALFARDKHRYEQLYLLQREAGFEDNGIRFHSEEESVAFDAFLKNMLLEHKIPFKEVSGDVPTRTEFVLNDLQQTQGVKRPA